MELIIVSYICDIGHNKMFQLLNMVLIPHCVLENFHSDGDTSSGLSMVRILREQSTNNVAVYVAHYHALGRPLSRRKKTECLASVIGGAVTALTVAIGPR